MLNDRVERVRGANDVLPEDYESVKRIENELKTCFASYGYRPIDVPVIEYTDLYLRKSGEELISRLYDFTFQSRRLCLFVSTTRGRSFVTRSHSEADIASSLRWGSRSLGQPAPSRMQRSYS
jgi:hypothetical protein